MLDIDINRLPVVILTNCRSGSTALAFHIANKLKVQCFIEPFDNQNILDFTEHKKKYLSYILGKRKDFVVKFMAGQINDFNNYQSLIASNCFKIRLNRRNKIDQILSLYVADKRNKYAKLNGETTQTYTIPIDIKHLIYVTSGIFRNDFLLNILPYQYDLDLTYEDIGYIYGTEHTYTDLPDNADEIRNEIDRMLKCKWSSIQYHNDKR